MADVAAHEIVEHLTIVIDDPLHVQRTESPKFHHNREYLIATCKLGCWLCAFQKDKSGTEPGVGGLEAHHVFEWSEWNDLDAELVTQVLSKLQFNPFSGHPVGDPDDLPNLVILHESCHRGQPGKDVTCGAHYTPFPIWLAQAAAKQGVTITQDVNHLLTHLRPTSFIPVTPVLAAAATTVATALAGLPMPDLAQSTIYTAPTDATVSLTPAVVTIKGHTSQVTPDQKEAQP